MRQEQSGTRKYGNDDESGLTEGIGARIKAAADAIGSRKEAARLAGVSDDMLYRYMREETPPRFEAVAGLARAAGFSLDWMATGQGTAEAIREAPVDYETEHTQLARERLGQIESLLTTQPERPVSTERFAHDETLQTALADLRCIARSPTLPEVLRWQAVSAATEGFGVREDLHPRSAEPSVREQRSTERLGEVADEIEAAIQEAGYRPPALVLDGFKTAMYVDGMSLPAAVTLLRFLDAHERKQQR